MAVETAAEGLAPVMAFATIGALGVGSQWLAWRLRLPAIVLMLGAGLIVGPVTGFMDPARDIGPLLQPLIAVAVAIILFEGGLTLNIRRLRDAAEGVRRLIFVGAPVGWLLSTLALRFAAGLSWESSAVFGGIMIVTGPTVIAPLLRQARLARRPSALLQWEAILNDPVGALAAVLAFEIVLVLRTATSVSEAVWALAWGISTATALGVAGGYGIAWAFRRGHVPEFMKVPVLISILLAVFGISDAVLHESGLLAVTIMGIVIANAELASYTEIRRFKEYATILLVSGVFILLAAALDFGQLAALDWRAALFVVAVIALARPLTVAISFLNSSVPLKEQILLAFTAPRGVVLVAVAGLFGERLVEAGVTDGSLIGPLAFVLVAVTVVVHGFTLRPFARALGLSGAETPGLIIVGASPFTKALAEALYRAGVPVLMTDPNYGRLIRSRIEGVPIFAGDILSEAAEENLELMHYDTILAATDNDAYNTLIGTDLGPEFGREKVYQVAREKRDSARFALPPGLGGAVIAGDMTLRELDRMIHEGWGVRITRLTDEFGFEDWAERRPDAKLIGRIGPNAGLSFLIDGDDVRPGPGVRLVTMTTPETEARLRSEREAEKGETKTRKQSGRDRQADREADREGGQGNGTGDGFASVDRSAGGA
ncbi:cation:proton antiporter [Wenxinia saemankumensis]|uniref:Sodium/proton antiporter, CPA1 family n=1 Tax=Wenxinia saemankumensis TaxID=1447782 RepID=A0A1M6H195_9RHOB|nr:sodium:proton antiporter [Wenxinia saemankumensis]SHJ15916.1 sodium/proton antiporter, CPA1 family [Wenxinia saemankumensis]